MSFHRVLPRPLALSNKDLADRWAAAPDSVRSAKIMTNERSKSAYVENSQISGSSSLDDASRRSTVHVPDKQLHSPPAEVVEISSTDGLKHDTTLGRARKSAPSNIDTWQGESPSQICLCQPDPKVPRPRNAFILYRQHHQASVVAQNPGLANPEISKVIGDHWRASPPEIKEHWKLLAEEEKIRHQKQYPDYRYQPRRSGRGSSSTELSHNPSVFGDGQRCLKCGGKSISSSGVMSSHNSISAQGSSPIPPQSSKETSHVSMPPPPATSNPTSRFPRGPGSPTASIDSPQSYRFNRPSTAHALPLASPRHLKRPIEAIEQSPSSPGGKRRRMPPVPITHSRSFQGPQTPIGLTRPGQRRPSLPRPDALLNGAILSPGGMGTLMRPGTTPIRARADSIQLPPIRTTAAGEIRHARSDSGDAQQTSKTLRAMIDSIPITSRIRVIGRVCGPLPLTSEPNPAEGVEKRKKRGVVITIDSANSSAIEQVKETLTNVLKSAYNLKVFSPPTKPEGEPHSLQSYLRLVEQYHSLNDEIIAHVTPSSKQQPPPTPAPEEQPPPPEEDDPMKDPTDEESPISPKSLPKHRNTTTSNTSKLSPPNPASQEHPAAPTPMDITLPSSTPSAFDSTLPIALLPSYHLTHTDTFAAHVPINDAYSPMDHWQWHATLWRGTVGPDVTVAIQHFVAEEQGSGTPPGLAPQTGGVGLSPHPSGNASTSGSGGGEGKNGSARSSAGGGGGNGGGSSGDEKAKVEDHLRESRALVVHAGINGVGEASLRRMRFETEEFVRGWAMREV